MPTPNLGFGSYILAGIIWMVVLWSYSVEAYRYFIKKEDRQFWSGLITLIGLCLGVVLIRVSSHAVAVYEFEKTYEEVTGRGSIGKGVLYNVFPQFTSGGCVIDPTPESKQCQFLMRAQNSDEWLIPYIEGDGKITLHDGFWPFNYKQEFPAPNWKSVTENVVE